MFVLKHLESICPVAAQQGTSSPRERLGRSCGSRAGAWLRRARLAGKAPARLETCKYPAPGSPAAWGSKKKRENEICKAGVLPEHPALKGHSQTYKRGDESPSGLGVGSAAGGKVWGRQTPTCFRLGPRFARPLQPCTANPTAFPTRRVAGLGGTARGCGAGAALPSPTRR